MKTCTKKLYCELTTEELVLRGNELAQELTGIVKLELGRARLNAKIKPKKERVEELAVIIDAKKEERDVKCTWHFDYDYGRKVLRRDDTYEQLDEDIIQEYERQQHLKFTGKETPGGYGVTDDELTETDEKARVVSSNEEAKEEEVLFSCQNTTCDNFNGDGAYENNCAGFTDDLPNQCKEFTSCDICNGGGLFYDDSEEGIGETYCGCRAGIELKEQEEASQEVATPGDPLVNEHGVYREYETIEIELPKKAKASAKIDIAQGADGLWRSGETHMLDNCGGGCGLPSPKNPGHGTREDAISASLLELENRFIGHLVHSPAAKPRVNSIVAALHDFRETLQQPASNEVEKQEEAENATPDDCEFCGNKGHLDDDSYCSCGWGKWRRDADKSELASRKAAKQINVSGPDPGDEWPVSAPPGEAA